MRLIERQKAPRTEGGAATLKSPGSEQVLELNWCKEGSKFGTSQVNGSEVDRLAHDVEDLAERVGPLEEKGPRSCSDSVKWGAGTRLSSKTQTGYGRVPPAGVIPRRPQAEAIPPGADLPALLIPA